MIFKGDFGLATSKFFLHAENVHPSGGQTDFMRQTSYVSQESREFSSLTSNNNMSLQTCMSNAQNDSISLSGAVGTALYVAPELLVPFTKNKFFYTQVNSSFSSLNTIEIN